MSSSSSASLYADLGLSPRWSSPLNLLLTRSPCVGQTGYKAIQFIACGVVPAVLTSFEHYHCLTFIQRGEGELCKGLGDAADTGGLTGSRWAIAAEPLRIGVVWLAFALLVSGCIPLD